MAQFQFDATNVAPRQSREVMPSGWYLAAITESEVGSPDMTRTIIKVELTIQDPPEFRGRKAFDNLNVRNPNSEAERIARETVSSINHAIGKLRTNDTQEWHGIPMAVRLSIEPPTKDEHGNEKFPAKNKVADYKAASTYKGSSQVGAQNSFPSQFPPAAAPSMPQWPSAPVVQTPAAPAAFQAPQVAPPPAPVQAVPVQVSPDGAWRLENGAWVPNIPQQPAPAALGQPPAQQPWAGAPAATAPGPWAQG